MFEAHVLHLLRKYLGEYVEGLSPEALRISVWKGDVVLKDLKLKAEALNSLKLPVTVKAGFVGTITLKVPWKGLGKEPVIVLIDRVFVLAHPVTDGRSPKEVDREKLFEAKLQQIEEAESATLEAMSRSKLGNVSAGNTWLSSLIGTVIGNLKISITNVHVRYEDFVSNPGHSFACGVTLAKLAAVTMDEQGNETFDTSGALDKLRKSLQLERLAVYHDSNSLPWKLDKKWEELNPRDWIEVFEDGINETASGNGVTSWARGRNYVVSPINGVLKYHRLGKQERNDPNVPFEKSSLILSDISLTVTEAQYHDWIRLLEVISRYKKYVEVSHLRPVVSVLESPSLWWRFAAQAGLLQKKMCYRFSWDRIQLMCHLRRRYIQLYAASLQQLPAVNYSDIRNIEKDLDPKVILLWRLLAHAKVESVKSKEAAEQRMLKNRSWFSYWRTPSDDVSIGDSSVESKLLEERLTKEEWHAINNLLTYQPEDLALTSGKDSPNMIHFLIDISIGQAAARIISVDQTEIVCGRFEQLDASAKFKYQSTHCDMTLKSCGLSAPEGSLAQSFCSEQKLNALAASFVRSPVGENVDWRLSATISPCHVTVFMKSYDRLLEFLKRSNAVSPTIALETAAALQNKIEKVTRRAQEQFQMVLEEQSRFALDIDLDAPKVTVPLRSCTSSKCESHFLLDFGHFTLRTKEEQPSDQRQSLYSRFFIFGRDIAAFFTDCDSDTQTCSLASSTCCELSSITPLEDVKSFYSLIDPCGMAVIVDQIKVPHPSHPSLLVSIQMPSLAIHFSPARYSRLMELLNIFHGSTQSNAQPVIANMLASWNPRDLATDARILVWRGIGYSFAEWQPCFLVLSGPYLYLLESEMSQSYQRRSSMAGKQVHEVPPNNVGGSLSCIAVCARGMDANKALESFNTLIIEFRNEEEKASWFKGLVQATYQASAPPADIILEELSDHAEEDAEPRASELKTADIVVNGALVETKLSIYGKAGDEECETLQETLIVEVFATGGKVHLVRSECDLTIKMKLHSLKVTDELQGSSSMGSSYLACSVLESDDSLAYHQNIDPHVKQLSEIKVEEDDVFRDALPEFASLLDAPEALIYEKDLGKGRSSSNDVFYEAEGIDESNFVSLTYLTRNLDSPDYVGIDTEMSIRMSKLEFFFNRPTLVALIGFGFDLSMTESSCIDANLGKTPNYESSVNKDKLEEHGHALVKGLLGHGKDRVVFSLNMNVDSVSVFLNKEDGSQLAMFVQESFLLDFKVHPSSISIEGSLGNFRLCDLSLGKDSSWGWLCDIRNQGADSLIQFTFRSFSAEDDDYEGYDYSLSGRLSAVRIVFLYRFVQEITAYFMGLAPPHADEAIKLVDKVGGLEWLIEKNEIDGASALKLDLSLDTPIIIIPMNSTSNDFIQLDLGHLRVKNDFSWHGCPEKDPSAVHLDILHAEIFGVNMAVGINGCIGKPMIREGRDICVYVRRSLRDIFRKVPTLSVEVKVGLLHTKLINNEYNVIVDCITMNLNEQPRLPPNFRGGKSDSKDTIKLLANKVNMNSQVILSRTVTIMAVEINYALLELCNGNQEDSSLAHLALEDLWVLYRMTSFSEADLYVTISGFSILDNRPDTKPEMRLMLGSCTDVPKQAHQGGLVNIDSEAVYSTDVSNSTMFLMDYRWRPSSQSFVVRIQQPRVLVVPDFVLAVGEFFVPALGEITGREELMDPKNDPIHKNGSIILACPLYKQKEEVLHLSPNTQLIADAVGVNEYTYDGCGNTICLTDEGKIKAGHSAGGLPSIIIGRGKRLRFVNVNIKNGLLLSKCTYLCNDSSYSISEEDGVQILSPDNISTISDQKNLGYEEELSFTSDTFESTKKESTKMLSYSFEAQVVSPEFTFYDSSKSAIDDSLHGEKLLRVKLDISFMYASKECDTWIRALLKDLTVEAGSGLIILDPVDVSGGYTSVKDKTNVSLTATDIYVHLSLSVISLVLNLQSQAFAALQLGNDDPLSTCTNFERIWVSPKENGHLNNLTFWRPRAPSNYVILGDCVTSRPIPPSHTVMAVSSTYGRVRKPLGFKLIGLFSLIQSFEEVEDRSSIDDDCSLWIPIAPAGYSAVGCVAHIGNQPPPIHTVHCIRSDLVTSSTYSECLFFASSISSFTSGFSIWRLDNVLGSFYAHPSTSYPAKESCSDLNLLLWNSSWHHSSAKESASGLAPVHDHEYKQTSDQNANSAGWDLLRSVSKSTDCYMSTPNFERIWWDRGSELRRPISIWRPVRRLGFAILGDCITESLEPPAMGMIFKADNPEVSAKPVQFTKVAHIMGKGLDEAYFWYPIAPPGYASLGCVVTRIDEAPLLDSFCCPRIDLVSQANILDIPVSRSSSSKVSQCWSIWKVENQACTFLARADLKKPSSRLAFAIGDFAKPKTRDNLTAEMKLRCFSLTVLDSLCGKITPLFDATITNIKLASHGRLNAMNVVLISSVAASTFNLQLEAWEPLVEPFDGIFKFETYDTNLHPPSRLGKRARVAATSVLNINLSAANLDTLAETITSWKRQRELEQKTINLKEEAGSQDGSGNSSNFSALDEYDFQTVVIENKLGCDIYLKKVEQNVEKVELLHHDGCASLWVPPPRYSDRLNVSDKSKEPRCYVAVKILQAKDLPILDDGNSQNFFCALRLVVDNKDTNQQKLFPQSARTKCVKPLISNTNHVDEGNITWNELFIFEVPQKGPARLEVEVTNLAAKAGKGEVVGSSSFSVAHDANSLKKVASLRRLHQASEVQNLKSYPLKRKGSLINDDMNLDGSLLVSTFYFERNTIANLQGDIEDGHNVDRDCFWLGLAPEGAWEGFRSFLPLSLITKTLNNDFIAAEVLMKNGKKHVIFRGLATIFNDSDVKLEISVPALSTIDNRNLSSETSSINIVVEEIFENQRCPPISGWVSRWPGFNVKDPARWSTRDFSYSSNDFFEPPIPPGWNWTSTWVVDKSQYVDINGWAYGTDFQSLKWPPTSTKTCSKSSTDSACRRRWIRTRQRVVDDGITQADEVVGAIYPGFSTILPWRSMLKDSDHCLLVRPCNDHSDSLYSWGYPVAVGTVYSWGREQPSIESASLSKQNTVKQGNKLSVSLFKLNHLEKKDVLFFCPNTASKQFWLSIGTDASVLQTELNAPVYDWKISVSSPLKLENRLPSAANFIIWEKINDGNTVEKQKGIISSRGTVHVYSVDVQNPIYLTLSVQGDWTLEKDPVLVLDILRNNHVSSFWMINNREKRRLRVSIERDIGGTTAAPKTIRLFVPYWISNDCSFPLAYRVVEIESLDIADADSALFSKAVKSARTALKSPNLMDRKQISMGKDIQILETIEDTSPTPSMLSPQDYVGRGGVMLFSSRNDAYLSPRVGIGIAIKNSEKYCPGISLLELEKKQRINVKAFRSDGSYYKLSALLQMTSNRTKVLHFQPHTLFVNRVGCSLCVQQCDTDSVEWIHPTDPPKHLGWNSKNAELLKLRLDGYKWSTPFSIDLEGVMCISLLKEAGEGKMLLRIEVRTGTKSSCNEVIFRHNSFSSPYRIENRSLFLPIYFRQVDGASDSWKSLLPQAAASFLWEDLGRQQLLEFILDENNHASQKFNIDEIFDHKPVHMDGGPARALRVTILKEEKLNVIKISDWMPENEPLSTMDRRMLLFLSQSSGNDIESQKSAASNCEFHVIVEVAELGLSIIDHTPQEILYLSMQNLLLSYSTGLGYGISRFKLRLSGIQVDNQLPLTPMPVLFRPQKIGEETDHILKFSVTLESNGSLDLCVYPYVGFQGPENSAFLINIHEPIIWCLHGMIQQVNPSRLYDNQTTAVSVDPIIQIRALSISEVRFRVSMAMSPTQRPVGVLGFWASLMTSLGNTENMPVRINQKFRDNVCMRRSVLISNAISNVKKDLLSHPLQLLSGIDILGNASSALGHMSKGVAALSMDKKFIQARQKQEVKGVEDLGDVIREGGGALAKGLFRGVTGILTKPLEGAKASGVEGFVQGVGKGIIGAAAQPVSGVLDLLSKTTEGANAMRMKIASIIASEDQLLRRRLPRVIGGDSLLRPYDAYKAQGQAILQLAECGSFLGLVDLFKVRGKFALSDAYEDHFTLPKGKILLVTHRRVILLQQTSNIIAQKKFNPARDPCSVVWDVLWYDLGTMELTHGKKDSSSAPPSRVILYLQTRPTEVKDQIRVIKCIRDSNQAFQVYSSIELAMNVYGLNQTKAMLTRKVKKPYSPTADVAGAEITPKDGISTWSPQHFPASVAQYSTFGNDGN